MMEIYAVTKGVRRDARRYPDGMFKCYPKGCNTKDFVVTFTTLEDMAAYLAANPRSGARMSPPVSRPSLIRDSIKIVP